MNCSKKAEEGTVGSKTGKKGRDSQMWVKAGVEKFQCDAETLTAKGKSGFKTGKACLRIGQS